MSLRLYSGKNSLETCTRTVWETTEDTEESKVQVEALREKMRKNSFEFAEGELEAFISVCPIRAIKRLLSAYVNHHGEYPKEEQAVFAKENGESITRDEISRWLKEAAAACGIPKAMVASHSLRRGGASAYVAAGLSDDHVCRFGRWTSMAYKAYVYQHAEALKGALQAAAIQVPRFEMN